MWRAAELRTRRPLSEDVSDESDCQVRYIYLKNYGALAIPEDFMCQQQEGYILPADPI